VILELPLFVTVWERECLLPTATLPKLRLEGFDPRAPTETPVPDSAIVKVGFDPSDVMVTVPLALPPDWGAKVTVNVVLLLGPRLRGGVIPLS